MAMLRIILMSVQSSDFSDLSLQLSDSFSSQPYKAGAGMSAHYPPSAFHPVAKNPHFLLLSARFEQKMVEFGAILRPKDP
jgi:hypothetical protein